MQYLKIMEHISEQINSGILQVDNKLPAERKLAESFNTTRVTLREALALLEAEGKVYREDRRGWFVSPTPLIYDPTKTTDFVSMARCQQRQPKSELISATVVAADQYVAQLLKIAPNTEVYRIDRVRYLDGRPVVMLKNFILPQYFPDLLQHNVTDSLSSVYREYYNTTYTKTQYRVTSSSLFGKTAKILRATSGSPAMFVERVNYNQHGDLIDCDLEYWRHDAISIESMAIHC